LVLCVITSTPVVFDGVLRWFVEETSKTCGWLFQTSTACCRFLQISSWCGFRFCESAQPYDVLESILEKNGFFKHAGPPCKFHTCEIKVIDLHDKKTWRETREESKWCNFAIPANANFRQVDIQRLRLS
jgi:hypothetical protein